MQREYINLKVGTSRELSIEGLLRRVWMFTHYRQEGFKMNFNRRGNKAKELVLFTR